MRGVDNIIPLMQLIVDQMTPVITITANIAEGDNWKLSMCETHWIKQGRRLTIGGVAYKVVSVSSDEYIIVSGASQPAVTWFQLPAPEFWHGSHRKVNAERVVKQDLRNDVVYLPIPDITDFNDEDSEVIYEANIRPLFLTGYDERYDNIADQQTKYIEPCNKMADYFITIVETLDTYFENPKDIYRREWPNFGNQNVWGNDKLIFDQKLSGVELRLTLEVFYEASCLCDAAEVLTCAPVNLQIEGVLVETLPSGDTFNLNLIDTNGDVPVHSYDPVTDTLEVSASGGGGSIDIDINGVPFVTDQSTDIDIPVINTATDLVGSKIGNDWVIGNTFETFNNAGISGVKAEGFKDIICYDSAFNEIGTVITDSTGSLDIQIADVTQTLNGAAITNNKAETSKAITIRYANNSPVVVTPITDTESVFIGEVPDVVVSQNSATVYKSGAVTSIIAEDDGATKFGRGVDWFTLDYNNHFGTTRRFTGRTGGYQSGGNYFDVNNVGTTYALAFPNDIVIDWACWDKGTGDAHWWSMAYFSSTGTNALANQPYTLATFTDWILPNIPMIRTLFNYELFGASTMMNYNPFNLGSLVTANRLWLSNVPSVITNLMNFSGTDGLTNNSLTTTARVMAFRLGNVSEL